jgi:hypothetical protein
MKIDPGKLVSESPQEDGAAPLILPVPLSFWLPTQATTCTDTFSSWMVAGSLGDVATSNQRAL